MKSRRFSWGDLASLVPRVLSQRCMGSKILYVDDENGWRVMVGSFLKLAGFDVVTASNGTEAMHQADSGALATIILDVNLAGEDGVALMDLLKASRPEAVIILYTGLERNEAAVQRFLEAGAQRYLRKGHLRDLVKCVAEFSRQFEPIPCPSAPATCGAEVAGQAG
jgi:DNA-binding response OmpR family regulator